MVAQVKKGTRTTAIQSPKDDLQNHTTILQQLKEASETALRIRGRPEDSFAKISELVAANVIRLNAGVVQPPSYLRTSDPGHSSGQWLLGKVQAASVSLDTAHYVEIQIDGVVVKLAVVT